MSDPVAGDVPEPVEAIATRLPSLRLHYFAGRRKSLEPVDAFVKALPSRATEAEVEAFQAYTTTYGGEWAATLVQILETEYLAFDASRQARGAQPVRVESEQLGVGEAEEEMPFDYWVEAARARLDYHRSSMGRKVDIVDLTAALATDLVLQMNYAHLAEGPRPEWAAGFLVSAADLIKAASERTWTATGSHVKRGQALGTLRLLSSKAQPLARRNPAAAGQWVWCEALIAALTDGAGR